MYGLLALVLLSAEPTTQPLFIANSTASTPNIGTLRTFEESFAVTLQQPDASIQAGQLVDLTRAEVRSPLWPGTAQVVLANGDRLPLVAPLGGDATSTKFNMTLSKDGTTQSVSVPLTAIAGVWFNEATTDELLNRPWFDTTKKSDALRLRNGDVVRGTFERFSDTGAVLFVPSGEKQAKLFDVVNLQALAIEPSLARVRKPKTVYSKVVLMNGARLSVSGLSLKAGVWNCTLLTGAKVTFPLEDLYRVDVELGAAVALADLKPKTTKLEPYGKLDWPVQLNRNAKGECLMLKTARGEEMFDSGLGLHSKTTLKYDLGGKYTRFEALVGLDANTGQKGHVEVSFVLDGVVQKWNDSTELSYLGGVKPVFLDVAKAKELTLIVDYGQRGDIQDDVNLVHPKLILTK
jgi:NPCBM/NEW2 domain